MKSPNSSKEYARHGAAHANGSACPCAYSGVWRYLQENTEGSPFSLGINKCGHPYGLPAFAIFMRPFERQVSSNLPTPFLFLFFRILFAEIRVNLYKCRNRHSYETQSHCQYEERLVAEVHLKVAGKKSGYHHAQSHKRRAYGVVRGLALATGIIYEKKHICGEAEAVSELLKENEGIQQRKAHVVREAHINIHRIGNGYCGNHGPKPFLQSAA